jgi:hypothetical protein
MALAFQRTLVSTAFVVTVAACGTDDHAKPQVGTEPVAAPSPQPSAGTAQPGAPPPAPMHADSEPLKGAVAETMDAAGYTYVRLTTPAGDKWAAVPKAKVAAGDAVTVLSPMMMTGFQSPTLHRTFDEIYFGTLAGTEPPIHERADPHAGLVPAAPAAAVVAPIPRATGPGAHTIAEVVAGRATLNGTSVTVRGQVTKYNPDIMGRNWLHVQDGSGKGPAASDILVTTTGTANVGDVVVAKGVVRTDQDFGAGYSYAVMVEDATLVK